MDAQHDRSSQSLRKPHALVFPWPGQGHINPMMQMSKKLATCGFTITFVNTEHNHARLMKSTSREAITDSKDGILDIRLLSIQDDILPSVYLGANFLQLLAAVTNLGPLLEDLMRIHMQKEPPITCIISDVYTPFTHDVANTFGIQLILFWTQSAVSFASQLIVTDLISRTPKEALQKIEPSNWTIDIPGVPPLKHSELLTFLQSFDPSDWVVNVVMQAFKRIDRTSVILMHTFEELESTVLASLAKEHKMYSIGPLLPFGFFSHSLPFNSAAVLFPEENNCLAWLDGFPTSSVLYVSFGSIAVMSAVEIEEFALGLEASDQPFLWVVRTDLMLGVSAMFPQGFQDRVKQRAQIVSWAPQLQVLSHPSVGGFVTHCGWNSTLESISAGVPMIGWPYFADQVTNCWCVVDWWKIGFRFRVDNNGKVGRGEVERKVRALMQQQEGSELRNRAAKLRDDAERTIGEEGSSESEWRRFLRDNKVRGGAGI